MATKAAPAALMPADVAEDIAAATRARDDLLERIAAGDNIAPGVLGEANDALAMAELRVELGERNAAEQAERLRLAEIDRIVLSLRSPNADGPAQRAAEVQRLRAEALDVLTRLVAATDDFVAGNTLASARLRRLSGGNLPETHRRALGELPAGVYVGGRSTAELRVDNIYWPLDGDLVVRVAADVAYAAVTASELRSRPRPSAKQKLRDAASVNGTLTTVERFAKWAGTPAEADDS